MIVTGEVTKSITTTGAVTKTDILSSSVPFITGLELNSAWCFGDGTTMLYGDEQEILWA